MRPLQRISCPWRCGLTVALLTLGFAVLTWRLFDLQMHDRAFLRHQGESRHLRVVEIAAHRGRILDRNGEPLAISTPVESVWAQPQALLAAAERLPELARVLKLRASSLQRNLEQRGEREFVYLRRQLDPATAERVQALGLPGVFLQREYRRYYPAAEVFGHVIGFTDIDDQGQEGLELAYDEWLRGSPGAKRVIKDRLGRVVEDVELIGAALPGRDLTLSLDRRIQFLAYRELKAAVRAHHARAGSIVVLDARNGEVLALANQPAFNPNDRAQLRSDRYRNRAVTDLIEPGSTVKPFTVASALTSGRYQPNTLIQTAPGWFLVSRKTIRDVRDFGTLDVAAVLRKSSNVGAAKIALDLSPQQLWSTFRGAGFGRTTGSGFPGESEGVLNAPERWHEIERATLAFGYGLSATPLQLARAYTLFATDGRLLTPSFVHLERPPHATSILKPAVARSVRAMLEQVVDGDGTGARARIDGYRVAGKTGTVRKLGRNGYEDDRYLALFVGLAPASRPRLVTVVVIDEPSGEAYYGGEVAAPVFARVMTGALRLLNVAPDAIEPERYVHLAGVRAE